jgi:elongation factor Ts
MNISAQTVKDLREKTGAGMMDCKKALVEADGDVDKAIDILRKQGIAKSGKLSGRAANQGGVFSYIHQGALLGSLVEIACETDFVAATEDFQTLGKNIAMQVAASAPAYLSREDVPADVLDKEKGIIAEQAKAEGKPEKVVERIVEGRLDKFYAESCLLDMEYIRDDSKTVKDAVTDVIAKLGENIFIRRIARFKVGE